MDGVARKHEWSAPDRLIKWKHCKVCLIIWNEKNTDKDCKGPGKLRPLEKTFTRAA